MSRACSTSAKAPLKVFESIGCAVDETQPDYPLDAVWQAVLRIRGWQQGGAIFGFYNDPAKRALLKPEAIYKIELGLKQSAYDITAASVVRSEWYQAVRRMFEKYDYFIVPTAQLKLSSSHSMPKSIGRWSSQAKKWKRTTSG